MLRHGHNTVKFLIGITPQGSVAYISQSWGGRTSDVHLTENSGLLPNPLPGDVILADRGFTILYCAEVKLPPFTRDKKQLSKIEVDTSCRFSQVCIRTCRKGHRIDKAEIYDIRVNTSYITH